MGSDWKMLWVPQALTSPGQVCRFSQVTGSGHLASGKMVQRRQTGELALGRQDVSLEWGKLCRNITCGPFDTAGQSWCFGLHTSSWEGCHPPSGRYIPGVGVAWASTRLSSTRTAGHFLETSSPIWKMFYEGLGRFSIWETQDWREASENRQNLLPHFNCADGNSPL